MDLADYLTKDRTLILAGQTKAEAIGELAAALADAGIGIGRRELEQAVWQREKLMTTGIGQGLAVPHVRSPGVSGASMAVGVSPQGIADYESLDGQPVHIVVMIVAPQGEHETYLRLLARIVGILKDRSVRKRILAQTDTAAIHAILTGGGG